MSQYLRPYQLEAKLSVLREWETVPSTLIVVPTGGGKTVIKAAIIEAIQPRRSLVLAHREELIWQAREKIERFTGLDCEIEMAHLYASVGELFVRSQVVVSTVQTQRASYGARTRMGRFKPTDFDRIFIDEGHHATAKSYTDIIHYYKQNPYARFLGVTATPDRADEVALGKVFDSVAFTYEIIQAIKDGWLVPIKQQFIYIKGLDFSHIRTTAGDLNGADLAAVMDAEQNLQGVAAATMQIIGQRRAIVFCASVKQAEMLSNIFNRYRFGISNWVCGKTNKDTRRSMLTDFKDNRFQIMCNCGVLTEGYDDWGVEVIVMARPTKSRALYAQMAGRGTRTVDGLVDPIPDAQARREAIRASVKPSCVILDFVGNSGRHKLMTVADILGGNMQEEVLQRAITKAKKKGGPVEMTELLEEEQTKLMDELKRRRIEEEARKLRLTAKVDFTSKDVNPFDVWDLDPVVERGWNEGKMLSERQRNLLKQQGINPDAMNYTEGKAVFVEVMRRLKGKLCSINQAKVLKRFGYDTHDLTRVAASQLLDKIKANGWKKPLTVSSPTAELMKPKPGDQEESPFQ